MTPLRLGGATHVVGCRAVLAEPQTSASAPGASAAWLAMPRVVVMDPDIEEIPDGDTVWRFDRNFLTSNWACLWGRGCQGIGPEPAEHLGLGCCSIGADLGGEDEARMIAALAATLTPIRFEHHAMV